MILSTVDCAAQTHGTEPMFHLGVIARSLTSCRNSNRPSSSTIFSGNLEDAGQLTSGSDVEFSTRSGVLRASRDGDQFQLDFPVTPEEQTDPPPGLVESLGVQPCYVGRSRFDFLVEVESEVMVRGLRPDFKRL